MSPTTILLRAETKTVERRSALTPTTAKALRDNGYNILVERSPTRCYRDEEFEAVGATLVPTGTWEEAPKEYIILGLKELPDDGEPRYHTHIHFGHCYKAQPGWVNYISWFNHGGGLLYDIEYLNDENNRRVAAFGYHAGYAGAAIALMAWAHQVTTAPGSGPLGSIPVFESAGDVVDAVKKCIASTSQHQQEQRKPRVLVIGARGRCGTGAVNFCQQAGVPDSHIIQWDIAETSARGDGPYPEINDADIFINCIYLPAGTRIPPFVTRESLSVPGRTLSVICDVSCDPTSELNPIPVYDRYSSFDEPTVSVDLGGGGQGPPLSVVSINHLPTLVAREASEDFAGQLLPSLRTLDRRQEEGVWVRAERVFREKAEEARDASWRARWLP
ncbi:hypothetical protein SI65_06796 [Aspergillus cristatus]|uniref:Saccharopine dehydrogenase [NAD(+), L-lysine-forming] n=1 Tax=Aspergillus cristatus TaxID=573508 RepID=A0A1E3BAW2_ASPCR|nr:hypothetical protein SI65_06796 [Aspergillus cristatus]